MRILALDVGKRRIGIAISDPLGITSRPYKTIERNKKSIETILDIINLEEVDRIIVGLPLHLSGQEGEQAKDVRSFVSKLTPVLKIPVELKDERLTTIEAEQRLRPGERKNKERIDAVAAAVLLEDFLKER